MRSETQNWTFFCLGFKGLGSDRAVPLEDNDADEEYIGEERHDELKSLIAVKLAIVSQSLV